MTVDDLIDKLMQASPDGKLPVQVEGRVSGENDMTDILDVQVAYDGVVHLILKDGIRG